MLSSTAIQKLERYGQLALKRNSVENFVLSSLSDPKRSNVYALTHLETWKECLRALTPAGPSNRFEEGDFATETNQNEEKRISTSSSSSPVLITDSLVYAISFTVSLLSYHLYTSLGKEQESPAETNSNEEHNAVEKELYVFSPADFSVESALSHAEELFALLKNIVSCVVGQSASSTSPSLTAGEDAWMGFSAGHAHVRMHFSHSFTESWAHLLLNTTSFLFLVLAFQPHSNLADSTKSDSLRSRVGLFYEEALVLLAGVSRQLRRCLARCPFSSSNGPHHALQSLFHSRPCAMLLRQQIKKFTPPTSVGGMGAERVLEDGTLPKKAIRKDADSRKARQSRGESSSPSSVKIIPFEKRNRYPLQCPMLRLLFDFIMENVVSAEADRGEEGGGAKVPNAYGMLEKIPLFQKVSLLYAILGEMPIARLRNGSEKDDGDAKSPLKMDLAQGEEAVRGLLRDLLAPNICNRATRYVIYYRGEDTKLMLSNVREPSEYALHTFTTTPPTESSLLNDIAEAVRVGDETADAARAGEACLSWRRRRAVAVAFTLAQWIASIPLFFESFCSDPGWAALAQEQRRIHLRRGARHSRGHPGLKPRTSSTDSPDSKSRGSSPDSRGLVSYASSLASGRASLLSTLSRASLASYRAFLAALPPLAEKEEIKARISEAEASADGNTNLPLILLEELALGLRAWMGGAPAGLLGRFGLGEIGWAGLAGLFAGLRRGGPAIFHLPDDVRFNGGLGYECLAIVFAKVLAPELEKATGAAARNTGEGAHPADVWGRRKVVDEAVSKCLAAYETIAPQVVDMKLPVILRMIAVAVAVGKTECPSFPRTDQTETTDPKGAVAVRLDGKSVSPNMTSSSLSMLHNFFANVVRRLGRGNKVPFLLDALSTSSASEPWQTDLEAEVQTDAMDSSEDALWREQASAYEGKLTVLALHHVCSHPDIREALIRACMDALDPENLLSHLLDLVCNWAAVEADDPDHEKEENDERKSKEAHARYSVEGILFHLQLVSTILEGVAPTSITSSSILEKAAELEMLLIAFAQRRLDETSDDHHPNGEDEVSVKNEEEGLSFWEGSLPPRPKQRRHLWLYTLYAIYQCRRLMRACMQDLGMRNTIDYVKVLEQTLWKVTSDIDKVVGNWGIGDLEGKMSGKTHMPHPPFVHAGVILPQLVLERLTLAQAVEKLLAREISSTKEAKKLAEYVLHAIEPPTVENSNDNSSLESRRGFVEAQLRCLHLANSITEMEWSSLAHFAKQKRMRSCLISLLRVTFSLSADPAGEDFLASARSERSLTTPLWLTRCLRAAGGIVVRAAIDVISAVSAEEILAYVHVNYANNKNHENEEEEASTADACAFDQGKKIQARLMHLPMMLRAMCYIYNNTGHMVYWPLLLNNAIEWLMVLLESKSEFSPKTPGKPHKEAKNKQKVALEEVQAVHLTLIREVLEVFWCCLQYEPQGVEILRRSLVNNDKIANGNPNEGAPSNPLGKGLSPAYVSEVGVFLTFPSDLQRKPTEGGVNGEETRDGKEDLAAILSEYCFEEEVRAVTHRLFSFSFANALLGCSRLFDDALSEGASGALYRGPSSSTAIIMSSGMRILAHLYATSLGALQAMWRERRVGSLEELSRTTAGEFLLNLSHAITERLHADLPITSSSSNSNSLKTRGAHRAFRIFLDALRGVSGRATTSLVPVALKAPITEDLERVWTGVLQHHVVWLLSVMNDENTLDSTVTSDKVETHLKKQAHDSGIIKGSELESPEASFLRTVCYCFTRLYANLYASWSRRGHHPRKQERKENPLKEKDNDDDDKDESEHGKEKEADEGANSSKTDLEISQATTSSRRENSAEQKQLGYKSRRRERPSFANASRNTFPLHILSRQFHYWNKTDSSAKSILNHDQEGEEDIIQQTRYFLTPTNVRSASSPQEKDETTLADIERNGCGFLRGAWRLFQQGRTPGMMAFWLLCNIQKARDEKIKAAAISVACAMYDPTRPFASLLHSPDIYAAKILACHKKSKLTVSDFLPELPRASPCVDVAVRTYYLDALEAFPAVLNILNAHEHTSTNQAFHGMIRTAFHALLGAIIPTPASLATTWRGVDASPPTDPSAGGSSRDIHETNSKNEGTIIIHNGNNKEEVKRNSLEKAFWCGGYELLTAAARALGELSLLPSFYDGAMKAHLERLLWVSTLPPVLECRKEFEIVNNSSCSFSFSPFLCTSSPENRGNLWSLLLRLCGAPARGFYQDESFVTVVWAFLHAILQHIATSARHPLRTNSSNSSLLKSNEAELRGVMDLITRTWIPLRVLWRQPSLLPGLLTSLFLCVLHESMRCKEEEDKKEEEVLLYSPRNNNNNNNNNNSGVVEFSASLRGQRLYNQLTSLFHYLAKQVEENDDDEKEEARDAVNNNKGDKEEEGAAKALEMSTSVTRARAQNPKLPNALPHSSSSMIGLPPMLTRLFSLAAVLASLFQVSGHFTSIFAVHSGDLDFIFADFLRVLIQHRLPQARAAPIAFHEGISIRPTRLSQQTLIDLVFTLIGNEDGKALLRQAIMRLEEEEEAIGSGGDYARTALTEKRHIFQVE